MNIVYGCPKFTEQYQLYPTTIVEILSASTSVEYHQQ